MKFLKKKLYFFHYRDRNELHSIVGLLSHSQTRPSGPQRIRDFGDNALYKSTFYLLTYLLTYLHTGAHHITLSWSEFMGGYNTADKC